MSQEPLHVEEVLDVAALDDATALQVLQQVLGVTLGEARCILAIARGELDGDVIAEPE